jgi:hypothetical protein
MTEDSRYSQGSKGMSRRAFIGAAAALAAATLVPFGNRVYARTPQAPNIELPVSAAVDEIGRAYGVWSEGMSMDDVRRSRSVHQGKLRLVEILGPEHGENIYRDFGGLDARNARITVDDRINLYIDSSGTVSDGVKRHRATGIDPNSRLTQWANFRSGDYNIVQSPDGTAQAAPTQFEANPHYHLKLEDGLHHVRIEHPDFYDYETDFLMINGEARVFPLIKERMANMPDNLDPQTARLYADADLGWTNLNEWDIDLLEALRLASASGGNAFTGVFPISVQLNVDSLRDVSSLGRQRLEALGRFVLEDQLNARLGFDAFDVNGERETNMEMLYGPGGARHWGNDQSVIDPFSISRHNKRGTHTPLSVELRPDQDIRGVIENIPGVIAMDVRGHRISGAEAGVYLHEFASHSLGRPDHADRLPDHIFSAFHSVNIVEGEGHKTVPVLGYVDALLLRIFLATESLKDGPNIEAYS